MRACRAGRLGRGLIGPEIDSVSPGVYTPDGPDYAYAFEWSGYYAPRALSRVLERGLYARVSLNPFTASTTRGDHRFERGSVVVSFDRQEMSRDDIADIMATIAREDGVVVHSLTSGKSAIGMQGSDVGGQFFRPLTKPEVLPGRRPGRRLVQRR